MTDALILRGMTTVSFFAEDVVAARKWYSELLGITPYFQLPNAEHPAYIEFRLGDYQHELGIIDRRYAKNAATTPGGAVLYWHVDDIESALERLKAMGAVEYDPLTPRGNTGFITASVIDPFGNILGIMVNPHYLSVLETL